MMSLKKYGVQMVIHLEIYILELIDNEEYLH